MREGAVKDNRKHVGDGKLFQSRIAFVAVVIAAATFLLMIVQLLLQVQRAHPQLTAFVNESIELTKFECHPDLVGAFTFREEPVDHLYSVDITIVNTGTNTIIGEGIHKMIVGDSLRLTFPESFTILDIDTSDDSQLSEEIDFDASAVWIRFKQWRRGEEIVLRACIASEETASELPLPQVDERDIENGTFPVVNLCDRLPHSPSPLILRLPNALRFLILVAAAISALYWATVAMCQLYFLVADRGQRDLGVQQLWLFEAVKGSERSAGNPDRRAPMGGKAFNYVVTGASILAASCLLLYLALTLVP